MIKQRAVVLFSHAMDFPSATDGQQVKGIKLLYIPLDNPYIVDDRGATGLNVVQAFIRDMSKAEHFNQAPGVYDLDMVIAQRGKRSSLDVADGQHLAFFRFQDALDLSMEGVKIPVAAGSGK